MLAIPVLVLLNYVKNLLKWRSREKKPSLKLEAIIKIRPKIRKNLNSSYQKNVMGIKVKLKKYKLEDIMLEVTDMFYREFYWDERVEEAGTMKEKKMKLKTCWYGTVALLGFIFGFCFAVFILTGTDYVEFIFDTFIN